MQPGPGICLCAYCPRRICRLHCACASAAPLSLLTLLVCCCVRSDDAETNESIGRDTRVRDLRQHRDRGLSPSSPRPTSPSLLRRHVVYSDCDCALATFVRTCLAVASMCAVIFCVLVSCAWSAGDAHALRVALPVGHAILHAVFSCALSLHFCAILEAGELPPARG